MPRFALVGHQYEPQIPQEEWKTLVSLNPTTILKPKELMERLYGAESNNHKNITYHEAKSQGHLCQTLLQTDKYFNLSDWLVTHWTGNGPSKHAHPLIVPILSAVDPIALWEDEKRTWLTPDMALGIWNIVNDARRIEMTPRSGVWSPESRYLGFNEAEDHPYIFNIVPCDDDATATPTLKDTSASKEATRKRTRSKGRSRHTKKAKIEATPSIRKSPRFAR